MTCIKIMFIVQFIGYVFLLVASFSSSVSMNFQKMAQYEMNYHDPRMRQHKRAQPLNGHVCTRPLFIIAIALSFAASTLDFLALTWLPPLTVGIFGAVSIIVNLIVSKVILFEQPDAKEWFSILCVVGGCILAISSKAVDSTDMPPPQLIEKTSSCVYIVMNWVIFILFSIALDHAKLPTVVQKFGFPFIGGALGAQNVCMGKYIAWAVSKWIEVGHITVRIDVLISVIALCVASIIVHIIWLNRGLAKHDAYYCIIVYQSAWFIFTTISGIVVYDNMSTLQPFSQFLFFSGCSLAMYGVWKISLVHKNSDEKSITQNAG